MYGPCRAMTPYGPCRGRAQSRGGVLLLLAHRQGMNESMAGELDAYGVLHILGVGGLTAIVLGVGYGIAWVVDWIVNERRW